MLSAALIVRDEAQFLGDCLRSLAGIADEVVVVDTGSTDGTPEIARRFGARLVDYRWNDNFAEARNVSLEVARGEWIFYIDADERLVDGDRATVERLLSGADEVAFRVLLRPKLGTTPYREFRLWRNDPRIRFEGIIHERVTGAIHRVAQEDGRRIGDCDLLLEHVGYEGNQDHKHRRNLPLLRAEIPRDPGDPFKRHHLARVLQGLGREDEAAQVLVDALEVARRRPHVPSGVLVFADLVRWRRSHGEDVSGLLKEARAHYPDNKALWWTEAALRISDRRYDEALELLDRLLAVDLSALPEEDVAYDERLFGELAHVARGLCLFRLGRYAEAAEAYAQASEIDPQNRAYRADREAALRRARHASGGVAPT